MRLDVKQMPRIVLWVSLITGMMGCASNLTLSDSIVFSDVTGYELNGYRFIEGGTLSANVIPGATKYGTSIHTANSISGLTYLNFIPSIGYSYGVASQTFAAAISLQLFMLGTDLTFSPTQDLYLTGNVTTSGSLGLACVGRISRFFAIGPFYRRDRFEGFVIGDGSKWLRDARYFAYSFGVKGSFVYSASSSSAQLVFIGAGYSPKVESIFVTFGMNGFSIH